jgi:hypothetical protein
VQSNFANPASEVVHQGSGRIPPAGCTPTDVGADLWIACRRLAAFCAGVLLLLMPVHATTLPDREAGPAEALRQAFPMEDFLDRLMAAESGGRLRAKNPRSTALGPFQFIESTFLFVVSKHFKSEVSGRTERQILARRTEMAFSRRAARAYVRDLISALESKGLPASPVNVRIAYLVGPSAAVRLFGSRPGQPLASVLSADAISANPFMSGATIAELVQRAAVEMNATGETGRIGSSKATVQAAPLERKPTATLVALEAEPSSPPVLSKGEPSGTSMELKDEPTATTSAAPLWGNRCRSGLASCRRWMALQARMARPSASGAPP